MSNSVRATDGTGMESTKVTSSGWSERTRWTRTPFLLVRPRSGVVTSMTRRESRRSPPEQRGAPMAEHRVRSRREDSSDEATVERQCRMAYRVHTAIELVKAARADLVLDRAPADPEREQLPDRNDPVLRLRNAGDLPIVWAGFGLHMRP